MSKGTIVLVPFPFTDLSGNKVRPCVLLAEQKNGEDCIVAFISSVKQSRVGAFEVRVKASVTNGLKRDSVLKVDKIATLQKKIILGELGVLEKELMKVLDSKLSQLFGLK